MVENEVIMSEAEAVEDDDIQSQGSEEEVVVKKKKRKPGIIYLSHIPVGFNVMMTRQRFADYGKVGRSFLQPKVLKNKKGKSKPKTIFAEGWIEFESKRVAKAVAEQLNNTMVGGRKGSKSESQLWNIKYLPRFKWAHLSERLAYEKATRQQRMRAEIFQAKKESHYFANNLDVSEKMVKWKKKHPTDDKASVEEKPLPKQRKLVTEEEKEGAGKKNKKKEKHREEFLTDLFGKT